MALTGVADLELCCGSRVAPVPRDGDRTIITGVALRPPCCGTGGGVGAGVNTIGMLPAGTARNTVAPGGGFTPGPLFDPPLGPPAPPNS